MCSESSSSERTFEEFLQIIATGNADSVHRFASEHWEVLQRKDRDGRAAVHYAANAGLTSVVEVLLDLGADVDGMTTPEGPPWRPVREAAHKNLMDTVKTLTERGADLGLSSGQPLVHYSGQAGNVEVTRLLVDAGAVDYVAGDDESLVETIRAAFRYRPAEFGRLVAENLQTAGHVDPNGYTLLHHLATTNDVESVRVLLAAGADPAAKTRHGETAIDRSVSHGFDEMANVLHETTR